MRAMSATKDVHIRQLSNLCEIVLGEFSDEFDVDAFTLRC